MVRVRQKILIVKENLSGLISRKQRRRFRVCSQRRKKHAITKVGEAGASAVRTVLAIRAGVAMCVPVEKRAADLLLELSVIKVESGVRSGLRAMILKSRNPRCWPEYRCHGEMALR